MAPEHAVDGPTAHAIGEHVTTWGAKIKLATWDCGYVLKIPCSYVQYVSTPKPSKKNLMQVAQEKLSTSMLKQFLADVD